MVPLVRFSIKLNGIAMSFFRTLLLLLLCSASFLHASDEEVKVYFCARLGTEAARTNNSLVRAALFDEQFNVFLPQEVQIPKLPFKSIERCAFWVDCEAIEWCDILLVVSPYGKDCAWEVGFAKGLGKKIFGFFTEAKSIEDTMVVSCIDAILTNNPHVYDQLLLDPRTKDKSYFLASHPDFSAFVKAYLHAPEILSKGAP